MDGVQTAEPAQRPRHAALDRRLVRDVARDRQRRAAVLAQGVGVGLGRRLVDVRQHDGVAGCRERARARGADAVAGARHEGDALRLVRHGWSLERGAIGSLCDT